MNKLKIQLDEIKEKLKSYQDESFTFSEMIKSLEDKLNGTKYTLQSYKNQLKEKENEIKSLKQDTTIVNSFKEEKAKYDKIVFDFQQVVVSLKEDNE